MDAQEYYELYGAEECKRLAEACGTNYEYFKQIKNGHRSPSKKLAWKLHKESIGKAIDVLKILEPKNVSAG